jgi:hypothetical protein
MSDEPLSPAEIVAWARDWLGVHERHRALGAELVGEEKIDLDIRAMRQVAETFERLRIVSGARHFATSGDGGVVNLPIEHIRRSVANEIAQQIAPMLRISEKWDGYRLRTYTASMTIVLPAPK